MLLLNALRKLSSDQQSFHFLTTTRILSLGMPTSQGPIYQANAPSKVGPWQDKSPEFYRPHTSYPLLDQQI